MYIIYIYIRDTTADSGIIEQCAGKEPTQIHDIIISMRKYLNFHFGTDVCGNDRSSELVSFGHDYILFGRPERDPCIIRPNGILFARIHDVRRRRILSI